MTTELTIDEKLLIGVLKRLLKSGYTTIQLTSMVEKLCMTSEIAIEKEKLK